MHESTVGIMSGLIVALIIHETFNGTVIQFSDENFFLIILPPIIFAAGYTLKKKNFIRSLGLIIGLGIFGTIIAMGIISAILYKANFYFAKPIDRSLFTYSELLSMPNLEVVNG